MGSGDADVTQRVDMEFNGPGRVIAYEDFKI
jgi:hypothetical protein